MFCFRGKGTQCFALPRLSCWCKLQSRCPHLPAEIHPALKVPRGSKGQSRSPNPSLIQSCLSCSVCILALLHCSVPLHPPCPSFPGAPWLRAAAPVPSLRAGAVSSRPPLPPSSQRRFPPAPRGHGAGELNPLFLLSSVTQSLPATAPTARHTLRIGERRAERTARMARAPEPAQ